MANTPRARALGRELRQRRERLNLPLESAAEVVGYSKAKISRVERADQGITEADVSALLVALGVTGEEREQLLKMARELDQPAWWEVNRGLPAVLTGLIDTEQRASKITEVAALLVPGLLQTRAYSRVLFEEAQAEHIADAIAVRQTRQRILEQEDPVELVVYIDESVLLRPVGSHEVMADQLRYLEHVAKWHNVIIRVLPLSLGYHGGLDGQFTVLELPGGAVNVHAESGNAGFILDALEDVSPFERVIARLDSLTLSTEESAKLLAEYVEKHAQESK